MALLLPTLIIITLILLNGLFVAAEFAIVGAPRGAIDRRASDGQRSARLVRRVLADPRQLDRFIATAQLGITLASLGLGMYGEQLLAAWIGAQLEGWGWGGGADRWIAAHTMASILAITFLTYFHIVVGEMVPKSLALQRAERTVLWIAPIMRVIQLAMWPLVVTLNAIGNGLLRLAGIDRSTAVHGNARSSDELAYLVRESQAGGLLRNESARVLRELFDFAGLTAGEVMVPRVHVTGIPLGATIPDLQAILRANPHTRYPVYDRTLDTVVGMVHVKDLLRCLPAGAPLSRGDTRQLPFVPESAAMDEVLGVMRKAGAQMAVVMDEHGGTAGVVTVEDLFEEVVGEFGEDRTGASEISTDAAGRVHVAGTVRLDDVGAALGVVLEHEAVDTTSGLVLALLGRPPVVGDVVTYDYVRFEVAAVEGHGVADAIVRVEEGHEHDQ